MQITSADYPQKKQLRGNKNPGVSRGLGLAGFLDALAADDGIDIVKFFKRTVRLVITAAVIFVIYFIGQHLNGFVNFLKCRIIIGVEIVFERLFGKNTCLSECFFV